MRRFDRGVLVKVIKLSRGKNTLGGFFLTEEHWLARQEGAVGIIAGMNPATHDVYFVMHHEEGKQLIAVYGADEIGVVDDVSIKLEFLGRKYQ